MFKTLTIAVAVVVASFLGPNEAARTFDVPWLTDIVQSTNDYHSMDIGTDCKDFKICCVDNFNSSENSKT